MTALVALAIALALALWNTTALVLPTADGVWRGLFDPPGLGRAAVSSVLGLAGAIVLARRVPKARGPLLALGLAGAPLVPVATGVGIGLLALQGPTMQLVAAAALCAAIVAVWRARGFQPPAVSEPALFVLAFAFYAALGTRIPGPAGPQGDEPHYLTMTASLLADGDIDLANQFAERDYRTFFAGKLEPHTSPASPPGRLYPVHAPGLAALMLPAYAVGGYAGARLLLSAIAALAAALVHRLVRETFGSAPLALAVWAIVGLTPPLPFYAVALYPETVGALGTAVFLLTARRDPSRAGLVAATATAAVLPWLHPKLLPLAAAGLLLTLIRRCSWPSRALALGVAAASVAALLAFFKSHFGHATLSAAYGPGFSGDVSLARVPWGLPALLCDRQFGLFAVGPAFVLALPGAVALARRRFGDGLRASLLGGATLVVGASFSMWWGGACAPARFVIPALPALALCLAPAVRARPRTAGALAGIGLAIVAVAADAPRALHNRADGDSGLLRVLAPPLDLAGSLPSFALGPHAVLLALTGAAAVALAWGGGRRGAAVGAVAYACVAGGTRDAPLVHPQRASLEALALWDGGNVAGGSGPLALRSISVPLDLRQAPWRLREQDVRNSDRLDLPPGSYRMDVTGRALELPAGSRATRLELVSGDLLLERAFLEGDRGASFPVFLPAGARRLMLTAVGVQGLGVVDAARLVPLDVVPRSRREALSWPRHPDDANYRVGTRDVLATALDRSAPGPTGFRLEGGEGAFLIDAPADASVVVTVAHARPSPADAVFWGEQRIPLASTSPVELRLPMRDGVVVGGRAVIPVAVRAEDATVSFGP